MTNDDPLREDAASGNCAQRRARASRKRNRQAPPAHAFAFRIGDACAMGGFGRTTAYKLVKQGKLKMLRVGSISLVCGDSLRALVRGRG